MPKEMLEEVREKTWHILKELLELDIEHTGQFAAYVDKLVREGRLKPLPYSEVVEERPEPRLSV